MQKRIRTHKDSMADDCWVFLSHAGEDKKDYVDYINVSLQLLQRYSRGSFKVFIDEFSLQAGHHEKAWQRILEVAKTSTIAVVVLTKHFVCKECPMEELQIFVKRREDTVQGRDSLRVVPVFLGLSYADCQNLRALYSDKSWWPQGIARPNDKTLNIWAQAVEDLCDNTGIRMDQANNFKGQSAVSAAGAVESVLKELGRVPPTFHMGNVFNALEQDNVRQQVYGRIEEVQAIVKGVLSKGVAVIHGPPGQGKSTVSRAAAVQLWQASACLGGSFCVDLSKDHLTHEGTIKHTIASKILADAGVTRQHTQQAPPAPPGGFTLQPPPLQQQLDAWDDLMEYLDTLADPILLRLDNVEDVAADAALKQELRDACQSLGTRFHPRPLPGKAFEPTWRVLIIVTSRVPLGDALPYADVLYLERLPAVTAKQLLMAESRDVEVAGGKPDDGKMTMWGCMGELADALVELSDGSPLILTLMSRFIKHGRKTPQAIIDEYNIALRLQDICIDQRLLNTGDAFKEHRLSSAAWLQALLSQEELSLLARLSMFKGAFNHNSATAIGCSLSCGSVEDALDTLHKLSIISLYDEMDTGTFSSTSSNTGVTSLGVNGGTGCSTCRYVLHPLIREVGSALLDEEQEQHMEVNGLYMAWVLDQCQHLFSLIPWRKRMQQSNVVHLLGSRAELQDDCQPAARAACPLSRLSPPAGSGSTSSNHPANIQAIAPCYSDIKGIRKGVLQLLPDLRSLKALAASPQLQRDGGFWLTLLDLMHCLAEFGALTDALWMARCVQSAMLQLPPDALGCMWTLHQRDLAIFEGLGEGLCGRLSGVQQVLCQRFKILEGLSPAQQHEAFARDSCLLNSMLLIALCHFTQGTPLKAQALCEELLQKLEGKGLCLCFPDAATLEVLKQLALCKQVSGQHAGVVQILDRAIRLLKTSPDALLPEAKGEGQDAHSVAVAGACLQLEVQRLRVLVGLEEYQSAMQDAERLVPDARLGLLGNRSPASCLEAGYPWVNALLTFASFLLDTAGLLLQCFHPGVAEQYAKELIEILELARNHMPQPHSHMFMAQALVTRARCLECFGLYPAAAAQLESALQLQKAVQPMDSPVVAVTSAQLAQVLWALEKYDQAEQLCTHALGTLKVNPGVHHPDTLGVVKLLADIVLASGKDPKVAMDHCKRALTALASTFPLGSIVRSQHTSQLCSTLACCRLVQGEDWQVVLDVLVQYIQGEQGGNILCHAKYSLAQLLARTHKHAALSQQLFLESMDTFKQLYGTSGSFCMASTLSNLAGICLEQGKNKEAYSHAQLSVQMLDTLSHIPGDCHARYVFVQAALNSGHLWQARKALLQLRQLSKQQPEESKACSTFSWEAMWDDWRRRAVRRGVICAGLALGLGGGVALARRHRGWTERRRNRTKGMVAVNE